MKRDRAFLGGRNLESSGSGSECDKTAQSQGNLHRIIYLQWRIKWIGRGEEEKKGSLEWMDEELVKDG